MLYYVYSLYCAQASGHVHNLNVFQPKKRGSRACVDVLGAPCSGLKVLLCQLFLLLLLFLGLWSVVRRRDTSMGRVSSLFATARPSGTSGSESAYFPQASSVWQRTGKLRLKRTEREKTYDLCQPLSLPEHMSSEPSTGRAPYHTRTHCGRRTYAS